MSTLRKQECGYCLWQVQLKTTVPVEAKNRKIAYIQRHKLWKRMTSRLANSVTDWMPAEVYILLIFISAFLGVGTLSSEWSFCSHKNHRYLTVTYIRDPMWKSQPFCLVCFTRRARKCFLGTFLRFPFSSHWPEELTYSNWNGLLSWAREGAGGRFAGHSSKSLSQRTKDSKKVTTCYLLYQCS